MRLARILLHCLLSTLQFFPSSPYFRILSLTRPRAHVLISQFTSGTARLHTFVLHRQSFWSFVNIFRRPSPPRMGPFVLVLSAFLSLSHAARYDPSLEQYNLNQNKTATHPLEYWGQRTIDEPDHVYFPSPDNWRYVIPYHPAPPGIPGPVTSGVKVPCVLLVTALGARATPIGTMCSTDMVTIAVDAYNTISPRDP